jgi:hypothetical protein
MAIHHQYYYVCSIDGEKGKEKSLATEQSNIFSVYIRFTLSRNKLVRLAPENYPDWYYLCG